MSTSLRNARSQISALHGRLEGLNLLNMDNVQAMVDRQVENITGVVNKLSSTCNNACPVQHAPQCKALSHAFLLELLYGGCVYVSSRMNLINFERHLGQAADSHGGRAVCFSGAGGLNLGRLLLSNLRLSGKQILTTWR